jgi:hypothetical protein
MGHCKVGSKSVVNFAVAGRIGGGELPAHYLVGYLPYGKPPEVISRLRKNEASVDFDASSLKLWFADEGGMNALVTSGK